MNAERKLWFLSVVIVLFILSLMPDYCSVLDAAELGNQDQPGSGSADSAGLNEISVMAGASAQSFYVVSDDIFVIMQKPMAKAYSAFSLVPVIASDDAGYRVKDADSAVVSSRATSSADASSPLDLADKVNTKIPGIEVAMNMNFREETDRSEEPSSGVDSSQDSEDIADPIEPINRVFFAFNDKVYFWVLKPVATAYGFFVPEWGRTRVRNVFDNIQAPIRLVNALLQLKMRKFGSEFARLVLNSTVGIAGLFDIASRHPELKTSEEDLGQTFGFYGFGEGFYLVLPFLGPSSLRDTAGKVGDSFLDPIGYITPLRDAVAVRSLDKVNDASFNIGRYEDIKESAVDPYISIRDIYKQYRRNKILE